LIYTYYVHVDKPVCQSIGEIGLGKVADLSLNYLYSWRHVYYLVGGIYTIGVVYQNSVFPC